MWEGLRSVVRSGFGVILMVSSSIAQETATTPDVSPAVISIEGLSENRFNPDHGTVFFKIRDGSFPADARDVAVLINDNQLPAGRLALSRRIIAAAYAMPPGLNEVVLRAWDAQGELLTADALVWVGNLTIVVDVVDMLGEPVDGASVTARLANQRSVKITVNAPAGAVEIANLPDENIVLEALHPDGRTAVETVPASTRRAILALR